MCDFMTLTSPLQRVTIPLETDFFSSFEWHQKALTMVNILLFFPFLLANVYEKCWEVMDSAKKISPPLSLWNWGRLQAVTRSSMRGWSLLVFRTVGIFLQGNFQAYKSWFCEGNSDYVKYYRCYNVFQILVWKWQKKKKERNTVILQYLPKFRSRNILPVQKRG